MKIKITSDSTCDLSPEQIAKHDIGILPLTVTMGDTNHLDGVDIKADDIYAHVAQGGGLPKTSANNIGQYQEAFETYLKEYDAVIHLNISSGFSSCYQNACLAAEDFENVYIIDSFNLSTGHGLLVMKAAELAESGMDAAAIVEVLRETAGRVDASFILDKLEYLKMGGRCSAAAALGANLLKLKPCIEVKDGKMGVGKKYRGAFEKCLKEYITDRLADREDLELDRIFITHSGVSEEWLKIAEETIRELQPFKEICITRAGCTVSSHCGPDTIGVLYIRK
ncbi:MAG: DegV family protein [Oscillospiraceae bacterium]|nr:DegV family protein [Oscillospiraceae bacterium]